MQQNQKKFNAIEKAIQILLQFQGDKLNWGVRELSQHLKFSPATVQRILQTLKSYHFVDQDPETRQYFLGNVFYKFLQTLHNSNRISGIARKFMKQLLTETRETVHLNIIEAGHRICIDTMESPRNLRAGMPVGHTSPLYAGASAKCLLAFSSSEFIEDYIKNNTIEPFTDTTLKSMEMLKKELEVIRKNGYAKSLGERTAGLCSISAPVHDHRGDILASLSLAIPEIRFSRKEYLNTCIQLLVNAAFSFSEAMGGGIPCPPK